MAGPAANEPAEALVCDEDTSQAQEYVAMPAG
jgi:hypothetical protein